MARWLWTILLKGAVGGCYNVGSGEPTTVVSFARWCSEKRGVPNYADYEVEQSGTYYVPDTSRAADELGLKCEVELTEAIERTLAWQKSQGQ